MSVLVQSDVIAVQASISGDDTTSMNTAHPALVEYPNAVTLVTYSVHKSCHDKSTSGVFVHEYDSCLTLNLSFVMVVISSHIFK